MIQECLRHRSQKKINSNGDVLFSTRGNANLMGLLDLTGILAIYVLAASMVFFLE